MRNFVVVKEILRLLQDWEDNTTVMTTSVGRVVAAAVFTVDMRSFRMVIVMDKSIVD